MWKFHFGSTRFKILDFITILDFFPSRFQLISIYFLILNLIANLDLIDILNFTTSFNFIANLDCIYISQFFANLAFTDILNFVTVLDYIA